MGYIKWWFNKYIRPEGAVCIPLFALYMIVTLAMFALLGPIAGFILVFLGVIFWGLVAYLFISDAWKESYAEYIRTKKS